MNRLFESLADILIARMSRRECDLPIGGKADPYLRRWYVIPRNRVFNIYLHNIRRSDEDRALHDHPWVNVSIILKGGYVEIVPTPGATTVARWRPAGSIVLRRPRQAHRLVVTDTRPIWTLFITGPRVRDWGFWCPFGWRPWKDFVAGDQGSWSGADAEKHERVQASTAANPRRA